MYKVIGTQTWLVSQSVNHVKYDNRWCNIAERGAGEGEAGPDEARTRQEPRTGYHRRRNSLHVENPVRRGGAMHQGIMTRKQWGHFIWWCG